MKKIKFNKYYLIAFIIIFGYVAYFITGFIALYRLQHPPYENPNASLSELSYPDSNLKLFYINSDEDNTDSLYSQFINGQDQKLIYTNNPGFSYRLLKLTKEILIVERNDILLLDETGKNRKNLFTSTQGKWISFGGMSEDENFVKFELHDDNYKVDPIGYELNIKTGEYKTFDHQLSLNGYTRKNYSYDDAISSNTNRRAVIKDGSLFVDDKELIHWPAYSEKFNIGCYSPRWLPNEDYLAVTCMGSLRIVDISNGKNAELDNGGDVDWFN